MMLCICLFKIFLFLFTEFGKEKVVALNDLNSDQILAAVNNLNANSP